MEGWSPNTKKKITRVAGAARTPKRREVSDGGKKGGGAQGGKVRVLKRTCVIAKARSIRRS